LGTCQAAQNIGLPDPIATPQPSHSAPEWEFDKIVQKARKPENRDPVALASRNTVSRIIADPAAYLSAGSAFFESNPAPTRGDYGYHQNQKGCDMIWIKASYPEPNKASVFFKTKCLSHV
jgi:hypothetical protein